MTPHFAKTPTKDCITNATNEAVNGVIQMFSKRAFGYRSFLNFGTAVLFHCGQLKLSPANA